MSKNIHFALPINQTALMRELTYVAIGNPPATHPTLAVGNFFPGLEFNFLNVWKRVFKGIELLESSGRVIGVTEDAPAEIKKILLDGTDAQKAPHPSLRVAYLYEVKGPDEEAGIRLLKLVRGPSKDTPENSDGEGHPLGYAVFLEWGNALSDLHSKYGETGRWIQCKFLVAERNEATGSGSFVSHTLSLQMNRLVEDNTALIRKDTTFAGELTESLCSPWQTDFVGCRCFYWASNRPDFINVEEIDIKKSDGGTQSIVTGHNWTNLDREVEQFSESDSHMAKPYYTLEPERLIAHEDVIQGWEQKLHFVIGGKDAQDGLVRDRKK